MKRKKTQRSERSVRASRSHRSLPSCVDLTTARTSTVAILLRRAEVIASSFRSRIARKSSILDRRRGEGGSFETRLASPAVSVCSNCRSRLGVPSFSRFLFPSSHEAGDHPVPRDIYELKMVIFLGRVLESTRGEDRARKERPQRRKSLRESETIP